MSITLMFSFLQVWVYATHHIQMDQLVGSSKLTSRYTVIPKWLFFQLNFGAKLFEIGHCVLGIVVISLMTSQQLDHKSWFWEKGSYSLGILANYSFTRNWKVNFYMKMIFLYQILKASLIESKYWRFPNMCHQINLWTIFWNLDFAPV